MAEVVDPTDTLRLRPAPLVLNTSRDESLTADDGNEPEITPEYPKLPQTEKLILPSIAETSPDEQHSLGYIERTEESETIRNVYEKVKDERSKAFLLLSGDAGVGKTMLADRTMRSCLPQTNTDGPTDGFVLHGSFDACHEEAEPFRFMMESTLYSLCQNLTDPDMIKALEDVMQQERQSLASVIQRLHPVPAVGENQNESDSKTKQQHRDKHGHGDDANAAYDTQQLPNSDPYRSPFTNDEHCIDDLFPTPDQLQRDTSSLSMKRFASLAPLTLETIASVKEQVAMVLIDNICQADAGTSFRLLEYIVSVTEAPLLCVGTCRQVTEPIVAFMKRLEEEHVVSCVNLSVGDFSEESLAEIQTTHFPMANDGWLFDASGGNPAVVSELVRRIPAVDLEAEYPSSLKEWTRLWAGGWTDDTSPQNKDGKEILMTAACFGHIVEADLLRTALPDRLTGDNETLASLSGLAIVSRNEEPYFVFQSQTLRDTMYEAVEERGGPYQHLLIGRRLLRALMNDTLTTAYPSFVVFQLRQGLSAMTSKDERNALISICLDRGGIAAKLSKFSEAASWLDFGLSLLDDRSWRDDYRTALALHNLAAEVALAGGFHNVVSAVVTEVRRYARNFHDTVLARCIEIYSIGASGRVQESVQAGIAALQEVGEPFLSSDQMKAGTLRRKTRKTRKELQRRPVMSYLSLPTMNDPIASAKMQILAATLLNSFVHQPNLTYGIGMRMVEITMESGLCSISALGFVMAGMFTARDLNIDLGYRLGRLAIEILAKFRCPQWLPRVYLVIYQGLHSFKHPTIDSAKPLRFGYGVGLRTGDIEVTIDLLLGCFIVWLFVCHNTWQTALLKLCTVLTLHSSCLSCFVPYWQGTMLLGNGYLKIMLLSGQPLSQVKRQVKGLMDEMKAYCQRRAMYFQTVTNEFIEIVTIGYKGIQYDQFMDPNTETGMIPQFWTMFLKVFVAFLLQKPMEVFDLALSIQRFDPIGGIPAFRVTHVALLTLLSAYHAKMLTPRQQRVVMRAVNRQQGRIKKILPMSRTFCLSKSYLMDAEIASVRGKNDKAAILYDSAIGVAYKNDGVIDQAFALEAAARHYLRVGRVDEARNHLQGAFQKYGLWGARTKTAMLGEELRRLPSRDW